MLEERNIHKSVMDKAKSLFTSGSYSVYNEDTLRLVNNGKITLASLSRPWVFVLEAYMRPTGPELPMVIVETSKTKKRPFEIGNRSGRNTHCMYHVLGRMNGERDDLASYLADNLGSAIPVYDYTSGSAVFSQNGTLEDDVDIQEVSMKRDEFRQDSALDSWTVVSFNLLTTK